MYYVGVFWYRGKERKGSVFVEVEVEFFFFLPALFLCFMRDDGFGRKDG